MASWAERRGYDVASRTPLWLLAASVVAIGYFCLRPMGGDASVQIRWCILCGQAGIPNIVLNIALYVPIGFAIVLLRGSPARAMVLGFFISAVVEVAQLWIPGRYAGPTDLMANAVGAALGGTLAATMGWWWLPSPRVGRALAGAWLAGSVVVMVATGVLMSPVVPEGPLFAGWSLLRPDQRSGLVFASIGGRELTLGPLADPTSIRLAMLGHEPIEVRVVAGAPAPWLESLLRITAGPNSDALEIGLDGHDIVIDPRFRGEDLGWSAPDLRFREALTRFEPRDSLRLVTRSDPGGGYHLEIAGLAPRFLGVSPARGWSLLKFYSGWSGGFGAFADALWLITMFLPLGLWAQTDRERLMATGVLVATAVAVPRFTALVAMPGRYYFIAIGAVAAGRILARSLEGSRRGSTGPSVLSMAGLESE